MDGDGRSPAVRRRFDERSTCDRARGRSRTGRSCGTAGTRCSRARSSRAPRCAARSRSRGGRRTPDRARTRTGGRSRRDGRARPGLRPSARRGRWRRASRPTTSERTSATAGDSGASSAQPTMRSPDDEVRPRRRNEARERRARRACAGAGGPPRDGPQSAHAARAHQPRPPDEWRSAASPPSTHGRTKRDASVPDRCQPQHASSSLRFHLFYRHRSKRAVENPRRFFDLRRRHRERRQHAHHAFSGAIHQQTRPSSAPSTTGSASTVELAGRASSPRRARR